MTRALTRLIVWFACSPAIATEVGRDISWQTLGSPNYVAPVLPNAQTKGYELPPLPDEHKTETGSTGQSLAAATTVHLKSFELVGATIFSDAELASVVAPYMNRMVTMGELRDLRLTLSRMYLSQGYSNSGVIIPDQKVDSGHIAFQAVEGTLTSVQVLDDPKLADRYIQGRLTRQIQQPLNIQDIKNALQNLQRDRNVDWIDARLAPGDELGSGILKIKLHEPKRFEVGLSADNHHSSSAGAERGRMSFKTSNLTGYGEVLRVSGSLTEGTDEQTASFEIPLTRFDTRFQAYYAKSDSDIIEEAFKDLDIASNTQTLGATLTQPLIDNLAHTISVTLGMEVKSSETTLLGEKFSFSPGAQKGAADTSVALLGIDWISRGDSHVAALRGTYRRGLDTFDATIFDPQTPLDQLSNPTSADGEFESFVTQGLYIKRLSSFSFMPQLNERAQLIVRGVAQISLDPLMSLEKLAIGGANTVRGYAENLLVRDNGAAATFELQFPITGYISGKPGWRNLVMTQFIDIGASWDKADVDLASSIRNTDDVRYIVGAGMGFIWEPLPGLQAQVSWAYDTADNFDGDDPRKSKSRDKNLQDQGVHFAVNFTRQF